MHIAIAAIGKLRAGPEATQINTYLGRARDTGRSLGFSGFAIDEFEPPRGLKGSARTAKEAAWFTEIADGALIALDERGKNPDSEAFAHLLANLRDEGAKRATFAIGGADGHSREIVASARHSIAFGAATWPHMLVRVMLSEQLYRSMTILSGHPYHRA